MFCGCVLEFHAYSRANVKHFAGLEAHSRAKNLFKRKSFYRAKQMLGMSGIPAYTSASVRHVYPRFAFLNQHLLQRVLRATYAE